MRIVTGREMAEIDRRSIEERGVPSLELMERAGRCTARLCRMLCADPSTPLLVLCGKGNNGGDGLVAARRLNETGYRPRVLLSHSPDELTPDGRAVFARYESESDADWGVWGGGADDSWFESRPVVVDALLGTGVSGPPRSPIDELIRLSNRSSRCIVGVDVPSGVDADTGRAAGESMNCRATVSFGLPKVGHFLHQGIDASGRLVVGDIGFPPDLLVPRPGDPVLMTEETASGLRPRHPVSAHKGIRGRTLLVAGSPELFGAAILAARAALASGTGLLTLAAPKSMNLAAKAAVPEAMTLLLPETESGRVSRSGLEALLEAAGTSDAVAVGPGLGMHEETVSLVREFVARCDRPLVIDADGLNALAAADPGSILRARTSATVLTPHPGEMARLLGVSIGEVEDRRWETARESAQSWGVVVLLKGAATVIADPSGGLRVNRTGTPAMAQGGMGDALTGIVLALLGQHTSPAESASLAAFIHGRAGEAAAAPSGDFSVTAKKLILSLDEAWASIEENTCRRQWAGGYFQHWTDERD